MENKINDDENKNLAFKSISRRRCNFKAHTPKRVDFWDSFAGDKGERSVCEVIFANLIVLTAIFLSALIPIVSVGLPILVAFYFQIGLWGFVYQKESGQNFKYENLFVSLKLFAKTFCVTVIKIFMTLFWTVCFIVPGVICILNYCFSSLIVFESPELDAKGVLMLSRELVKGYRLKIFFFALLSLSTICVAMTLMFAIVMLFDYFFVVPAVVYIVLVFFAAILDFVTLALPLFEVIVVDCFVDAKNCKKRVGCSA